MSTSKRLANVRREPASRLADGERPRPPGPTRVELDSTSGLGSVGAAIQRWTDLRGTVATIAGVLTVAAAGCAGFRNPDPVATDVAPQKVQRREEVVRQFEAARDQAQYQAAVNFLHQGNNKSCRQSIDQLLGRNSTHHDGRLLLADLLIDEQDYDGAEKRLRDVLATSADDARAEHTLGLVLDAKGQADEAQTHYARAAQLDPKNETYRLSCQLAAGAALGGPAPAVAARSTGKVVAASAKSASAAEASKPAQSAAAAPAGTSRANGAEESADVSEMLYRLEAALSEKNAAAIRAAVDDLDALAPNNPQSRLKAAVIALRHEKAELAAEIATSTTVRFPKSAEAFRILGTAKYRLHDYAAAQSALATALSLDNSSGLAYFLMGCTLNKLGKPDAAAGQFARAAELDPRFAKSAH